MHDRTQYHLAIAGLIMTLIGLGALFIVPLAVAARLKNDFDKIDRLEHARLAITEAIEVASRSDTFLTHRYMEPGATNGRYVVATEHRQLLAAWDKAIANPGELTALDRGAMAEWRAGTAIVTRWINGYLADYVKNGNPGSATRFEREEQQFRLGLFALSNARSEAIQQQDDLRQRLQWLNTAQLTVITPMAIICFALAFLAWMNVRTLQQTWSRERSVSAQLQVAVQESNHRIKNNLQVIGALIDMQLQEPGTVVRKSALENVVHQVRAVAAVHDFFSHELRSSHVMGDQMLRRLIELTASPIGLRVDLETEAIALAVKQATAVALITNELLLNSGKHGATEARVVMKATGSMACLRVSDNGPGFPDDFDGVQDANLGLALVDSLARHDLQGQLIFSSDAGAHVEITFPLAAAA